MAMAVHQRLIRDGKKRQTQSAGSWVRLHCVAPVAASTTIVPVMCGCSEQKYSYVPGVVKVTVDYDAGLAVVTFETSKQSPETLSRFVAACGYKVKETKVV